MRTSGSTALSSDCADQLDTVANIPNYANGLSGALPPHPLTCALLVELASLYEHIRPHCHAEQDRHDALYQPGPVRSRAGDRGAVKRVCCFRVYTQSQAVYDVWDGFIFEYIYKHISLLPGGEPVAGLGSFHQAALALDVDQPNGV